MPDASHRSPGADEDAEFERARELLERTVQFLRRCMEDPRSALETEDPRVLIQGLKALSARPLEEDHAGEDEASAPEAIPIRRRRSA